MDKEKLLDSDFLAIRGEELTSFLGELQKKLGIE